MTPMFDEFDKKLREALASEALPPDGFADRVMARVAGTPQQKRMPSPARRWLLSAAACLVVAAALIPLLRSGGLGSKNASGMAADTAGDGGMMQSAPSAGGLDDGARQDSQQKSSLPDTDSAENSAGADDHAVDRAPYQSVEFAAAPSAMDDALARAADTLTAQGYTLIVTALEDGRVQALLTDAGGNAADDALTAAMETEGFAAAGDGWYTYEEDMDS